MLDEGIVPAKVESGVVDESVLEDVLVEGTVPERAEDVLVDESMVGCRDKRDTQEQIVKDERLKYPLQHATDRFCHVACAHACIYDVGLLLAVNPF